jgi:hypothetical protein
VEKAAQPRIRNNNRMSIREMEVHGTNIISEGNRKRRHSKTTTNTTDGLHGKHLKCRRNQKARQQKRKRTVQIRHARVGFTRKTGVHGTFTTGFTTHSHGRTKIQRIQGTIFMYIALDDAMRCFDSVRDSTQAPSQGALGANMAQ